jgi:2-polyprenyl-3-methyl-5-hydroxy-6-metoxy-1,4-benzoquinol methylase
MDQEGLDQQSHRRALAGLARINSWSRSAALLWPAIVRVARRIEDRPVRLLDIASGGGDVCLALWRMARRAGIEVEILGLDISPVAVAYAREQIPSAATNVRFEVQDVFQQGLTDRYDITMSSLFLHHLKAEQAAGLLANMAAMSEHLLVINDLCRSRSGIVMAHVACQLLTRSHIVHADGPQSVAASFTTSEMKQLFVQAGLPSVHIEKRWPFRQLAQWSPSC